jgi:mannosyltransferase OCH1-like enzyme
MLSLSSLSFRHLNDTVMDAYLSGMFPPPSPMSTILSTVRKPVLKADILRYAILLHKGGIYTDIDTAATRPFKDWGTSRTIDLVSIYLALSATAKFNVLQLVRQSTRSPPLLSD